MRICAICLLWLGVGSALFNITHPTALGRLSAYLELRRRGTPLLQTGGFAFSSTTNGFPGAPECYHWKGDGNVVLVDDVNVGLFTSLKDEWIDTYADAHNRYLISRSPYRLANCIPKPAVSRSTCAPSADWLGCHQRPGVYFSE